MVALMQLWKRQMNLQDMADSDGKKILKRSENAWVVKGKPMVSAAEAHHTEQFVNMQFLYASCISQ
jgi:hypothetical protein